VNVSARRIILLLVIAWFAVLFFVPTLLGFLVDWWWFQEIGYQIVFTRELVTQLLLFLIVGGLTFSAASAADTPGLTRPRLSRRPGIYACLGDGAPLDLRHSVRQQ
jgi:uncharacterized membrane protein (UPF0182 family)